MRGSGAQEAQEKVRRRRHGPRGHARHRHGGYQLRKLAGVARRHREPLARHGLGAALWGRGRQGRRHGHAPPAHPVDRPILRRRQAGLQRGRAQHRHRRPRDRDGRGRLERPGRWATRGLAPLVEARLDARGLQGGHRRHHEHRRGKDLAAHEVRPSRGDRHGRDFWTGRGARALGGAPRAACLGPAAPVRGRRLARAQDAPCRDPRGHRDLAAQG